MIQTKKKTKKNSKNKDGPIELLESIRNLMILNLSYTNAPHDKIAKAAKIRKSKLYDIIPKRKKKQKKISKVLQKT